jgi:hypothetical protein
VNAQLLKANVLCGTDVLRTAGVEIGFCLPGRPARPALPSGFLRTPLRTTRSEDYSLDRSRSHVTIADRVLCSQHGTARCFCRISFSKPVNHSFEEFCPWMGRVSCVRICGPYSIRMQSESSLRRPRGGGASQFAIEAEVDEAIAPKQLLWSTSGAAAALTCHHECSGGHSPGVPMLLVKIVYQHEMAILIRLNIPSVDTHGPTAASLGPSRAAQPGPHRIDEGP